MEVFQNNGKAEQICAKRVCLKKILKLECFRFVLKIFFFHEYTTYISKYSL